MEHRKPVGMNGVLKTALVVGLAIAVETLLLQRLFTDLPRGVFLGIFLVASVLLIALQHALSKRRLMRPARPSRRRSRQEPSPVTWSGLEPSSVQTTQSIDGLNHKSALQGAQMADSVLPDEDGIIKEESS